jgi:hypothetical protein
MKVEQVNRRITINDKLKKHQEMTRCSKANGSKSTTITKRFMVTIKELSKTLGFNSRS